MGIGVILGRGVSHTLASAVFTCMRTMLRRSKESKSRVIDATNNGILAKIVPLPKLDSTEEVETIVHVGVVTQRISCGVTVCTEQDGLTDSRPIQEIVGICRTDCNLDVSDDEINVVDLVLVIESEDSSLRKVIGIVGSGSLRRGKLAKVDIDVDENGVSRGVNLVERSGKDSTDTSPHLAYEVLNSSFEAAQGPERIDDTHNVVREQIEVGSVEIASGDICSPTSSIRPDNRVVELANFSNENLLSCGSSFVSHGVGIGNTIRLRLRDMRK